MENFCNTKYQINHNSLLAHLKRKIRNLAVFARQGQLVGMVKDLLVDAHQQLNIMVSQIGEQKNQQVEDIHRYFLLPSKLIGKINIVTKSVLLNIDKLVTEYMSEYPQSEITTTSKNLEMSQEQVNLNNQNTVAEHPSLGEHPQEEIIRLLGERLKVDRNKRKVGDVIIRKQIETRMVQIPVRREKLIVEQVSPEYKQLAEINLGQEELAEELTSIELTTPERQKHDISGGLTISGDFNSPKIASLLLNAIALERNHGCKKVSVTITVEDEEQKQKYQEWFERTSIDPKHN
ncbi:MAG: YsnF/AvaK domain-containing protein [Fischerella sp.]|nr:YsnF/AvaK domain-containing protein [Fischerella sp.]